MRPLKLKPSSSDILRPSRSYLLILHRQLGIKYSCAQDLLGTSHSNHQSLTLVILVAKPHFSWEMSILIVLSEFPTCYLPRSSICNAQCGPQMLLVSLVWLSLCTAAKDPRVKGTHREQPDHRASFSINVDKG